MSSNPSRLSDLMSTYARSVAEGRLPYLGCRGCESKFPYPRSNCPRCGSHDLEIRASDGRGEIYTMTILYRSPDPSVQVPFVVAMVELREGLKVIGNVFYEEGLSIGDDVVVRFDERGKRPQMYFQRV
jgi:uncharacterized protein